MPVSCHQWALLPIRRRMPRTATVAYAVPTLENLARRSSLRFCPIAFRKPSQSSTFLLPLQHCPAHHPAAVQQRPSARANARGSPCSRGTRSSCTVGRNAVSGQPARRQFARRAEPHAGFLSALTTSVWMTAPSHRIPAADRRGEAPRDAHPRAGEGDKRRPCATARARARPLHGTPAIRSIAPIRGYAAKTTLPQSSPPGQQSYHRVSGSTPCSFSTLPRVTSHTREKAVNWSFL